MFVEKYKTEGKTQLNFSIFIRELLALKFLYEIACEFPYSNRQAFTLPQGAYQARGNIRRFCQRMCLWDPLSLYQIKLR